MSEFLDKFNNNRLNIVNNEKPLRICILGGGGFLGQKLTSALQKFGHFIVMLDLNFPEFPHIFLNSNKMLQIKASILDKKQLSMALENCDACFHLAGYGMSGGTSLNYKMNMLVNFEGTKMVIEECRRAGIQRLIYSSSVSIIFNNKELHNVDETIPYVKKVSPKDVSKFGNAYAESKCYAEQAILKANNDSSFNENGLNTCALRLRGIWGPGEVRATQRTAELALKGIVKATFEKSPNCKTQYSSCENCINALILVEKSLRLGSNSPAAGQAYYIVDEKHVHPFKFWYPLIRGVGAEPPRLHVPYRLIYFISFIFELMYHIFGIEPLFTRFEINLMAITNTYSTAKAERDFGYKPSDSEVLMQQTVEFFTKKYQIKENSSASGEEKKRGAILAILKRFFGAAKDANNFNKIILIVSLLILSFLLFWPIILKIKTIF